VASLHILLAISLIIFGIKTRKQSGILIIIGGSFLIFSNAISYGNYFSSIFFEVYFNAQYPAIAPSLMLVSLIAVLLLIPYELIIGWFGVKEKRNYFTLYGILSMIHTLITVFYMLN
jgi:hypothetical protein